MLQEIRGIVVDCPIHAVMCEFHSFVRIKVKLGERSCVCLFSAACTCEVFVNLCVLNEGASTE